jgi:hypothetical protein
LHRTASLTGSPFLFLPVRHQLSIAYDVRTRIDILHFRFAGIDQTAPSAAKRLVEGDVISRDCHAALQQGIFWRFFWTLALTIAGVILVVVAISTIFGLSPPKGAAEDLIETAILDSAATVLKDSGTGALARFAAAAASFPASRTNSTNSPLISWSSSTPSWRTPRLKGKRTGLFSRSLASIPPCPMSMAN